MRYLLLAPLVALVTMGIAAPAVADGGRGQVKEIIIKIETEDGPRWYTLGKELNEIDVREGDRVQFDYADDTIEAIEVENREPGTKETNDGSQ